MTSVTTGSCACGAIEFKYTGDPLMTGVCHCTDCRKWTSSIGTINAVVSKDLVEITKGTPKSWKKKGTSGKYVERFFCVDCGSPLWGDVEIAPGALFIKAGVLDGEGAHLGGKLDKEWWAASKLKYVPEFKVEESVQTQGEKV